MVGVHRDPVEVGDAPLVSDDGVTDEVLCSESLQQRRCAARLVCLPKGEEAHSPEALEGSFIDPKHRLPIRLARARDAVGNVRPHPVQRALHHCQLGVGLEAAAAPYGGGAWVEGRRVDRVDSPVGEVCRDQSQELRSASIEPDHRIGVEVVPRSGSGAKEACAEGDGLGPGPVDAEKRRHLWESMKMEVVVASHPSALLHDTGRRHPERPARVEAVRAGIEESGLGVHAIESPSIERNELALVHDPSYIEMIHRFCAEGGGALDMDTLLSPESWEAALTAAGGVRALVEELESSPDATGFALCRPPGHHALADRAMGFCVFNNVAVAAAYLRSRGERVGILDWDVHHGNGTQAMLGDDPGTLYVSLHQDRFYPFEGSVGDIDSGDAKGTIVNIPLPAATAGDVYREAWSDLVIPVVSQFQPSWVFISAGFDAHADDHLAHLRLESSDYGWMAAKLSEIYPPNRTVVVLEGGYDMDALRESARATVLGLDGEPFPNGSRISPPQSATALETAATAIARHWSV